MTATPRSPSRRTRFSETVKRVLHFPLLVLAVIVVLVDDAFRAIVVPAVQALARLSLVQRVEAAIARLPPYATLALFIIPLAIIEPFKIYGLYLFGRGQFVAGCVVFAVAKVVGLGLAERLFAVSRAKLLSIGWFAWCYGKVMTVRDWVHAWLESTAIWHRAKRLVRRVREGLGQVRQALIRIAASWSGGGLLEEARRRLWHPRP